MFDFGKWTSAFNDWLLGTGMADWLAILIECVLIGVGVLLVYTVLALFYILYERKLCAWFQCRLGPMRVGKWGLLQVFADMFKILIKELICLKGTDRFLFKLAPYLVITSSVVMLACLPWGNGLQIIDWNIGIFFVLAVSSVGVLGILLAGWSSNNKYTLIGAMRSGAQMVTLAWSGPHHDLCACRDAQYQRTRLGPERRMVPLQRTRARYNRFHNIRDCGHCRNQPRTLRPPRGRT